MPESGLENLDESGLKFAYEVKRGHGIDGHRDGIVYKNVLASYAHLRSLENYNWAARFAAFVREVREVKEAAAEKKWAAGNAARHGCAA